MWNIFSYPYFPYVYFLWYIYIYQALIASNTAITDQEPSNTYATRTAHVEHGRIRSINSWLWAPIVMYRHESWTTKKAECRKADAFELWCWRRLLRVPWDQSILRKSTLNIHWKNWCWSSNTLATLCKEPTHWKTPWCWERLKAGGE